MTDVSRVESPGDWDSDVAIMEAFIRQMSMMPQYNAFASLVIDEMEEKELIYEPEMIESVAETLFKD